MIETPQQPQSLASAAALSATDDKSNGNNIPQTVEKWSTKEKLFLISFVLLNGDSNWTYVSEQLKKWMLLTSTDDDSTSLSNNFPKRTSIVSIQLHF